MSSWGMGTRLLVWLAVLLQGCQGLPLGSSAEEVHACAPTVPLAPSLAPGSAGQPSRELVAGGTEEYGNVAELPEDAYCSDVTYDRVDFCTNRLNPPAPSVVRHVGYSRPRDGSDTVSPYLAASRSNADYEGGAINFVCRTGIVNSAVRRCYVRSESTGDFNRCPVGDRVMAANETCPTGHTCYNSAFNSVTVRCDSEDGPPAPAAACPGMTQFVTACAATPASIPANAPRQGDRVVLPYVRTSNDGRLIINPGFGSWPEISLLRPEALTADHTLAADHSALSRTGAAEMNPFTWFNPIDTGFAVRGAPGVTTPEINQLHIVADLSHSMLCDSSSSEYNANGRLRNPVPCSARYGDYAYDNQAPSSSDLAERHGVCYRVTFLSNPSQNGHWELRSAPITVFVPDAYRSNTEQGIWVYPDNPMSAFDTTGAAGNVTLPDFAHYDVGRMFPWSALTLSGAPQDLTTLVTSTSLVTPGNALPVNAGCYQLTGTGFAPTLNPPAWCEFLYNQHRSSRFYFDNNRDAVADRFPGGNGLTEWDGSASSHNLFEIAATGDGRVLIVNENGGFYYATNSVGPCRADGFFSFLPYSLMPVDPILLAGNYGIARSTEGQPFRDSTGAPIPFGSLQRFAYGWIDRAGANLLVATFNEQRDAYYTTDFRRLPTDGRLGTPNITPVLNGGEPNTNETPSQRDHLNTRAGHHVAVLGAWTGGQLITVDNGLNATDFGGSGWFGMSPGLGDSVPYRFEFSLPLYREHNLQFIPVGSSMLNSFENRFNYFEAFTPHAPFDVVWTTTSDNQTMSEIIFDDYMDRRAFAVVHMNAAIHIDDTPDRRALGGAARMVIDDGFVPTGDFWGDPNYIFNTNEAVDPMLGGRVLLQNAAPHSGMAQVVLRGGARIEPVALGGVLGRGVFLDGRNDHLQMTYRDSESRDWYLGMWIEPQPETGLASEIDPDELPGEGTGSEQARGWAGPGPRGPTQYLIRELFHFADGSFIGLKENASGFNVVAYAQNPGELQELTLGDLIAPGRFAHIGVRTVLEGPARIVYVYVNGTEVGVLSFAGHGRGLTVMGNCSQSQCGNATTFTVGAPALGSIANHRLRTFHGWTDELRVYRLGREDAEPEAPFREQICNFALGTLAAHRRGAPLPQRLSSLLQRYEEQSGYSVSQICDQLIIESIDEPFDFARQRNRTDCAAHVHDAVLPAYCIRAETLGLPALIADSQRPDSSTNGFCLSCHTDTSPIVGLRVGALQTQSPLRFADRRRQPLNPPAVLGLPQHSCPVGPQQLHGTFYGLFQAHGSHALPDGTWTTDHVFDGEVHLPPGPN